MTARPKALDLFCCAGGASTGLARAGFDVTGVDIKPQPYYPFAFHQADALTFPLGGYAFIWASPVCYRWTPHAQQRGTADHHPDQIAAVRARLSATGAVWCMENVPRSPIRPTLILTGDMFGLNTYRRRHFETNFVILAPQPGKPFGPKTRPGSVTVCGNSGGSSKRDGWSNGDKAAWQRAMGIDWMTNAEMAEAIPPAYAEFIGRAALQYLRAIPMEAAE